MQTKTPLGNVMSAGQAEIEHDNVTAYQNTVNRPGVTADQKSRTNLIMSGMPVKQAWAQVARYSSDPNQHSAPRNGASGQIK